MLTQHEILQHLLARRLISREAIVDGDVRITDVSRHNSNCRVTNERGSGWLIKQGSEQTGIGSLAHEAGMYRSLATDASFARYLPPCHGYDAGQRLLIIDLLRDSRDLRDYHARRHRFPRRVAADAGALLATLHRVSLDRLDELPERVPPVLSLPQPPLDMIQSVSGGNLRLIATIRRVPPFYALLDAAHADWRATALIHGDARWDNFLIVRSATNRRRTSLRLIDWESASRGDPCWDAGSFLSEYLSYWLFSIPVAGDLPPERLVALARVPLHRLRPAMNAFWRAYAEGMALDDHTARAWLARTVRYAAVRLIDRACEQMDGRARLTGMVTFLLQLSLNMLKQPAAAATQLLGIWRADGGRA